MKNLKKVLSLALAFAMVLGLCVTGMAAQDVTTLADWETVTDKDSAMLLNAFEIMQGDENGFRPNDLVKRSEAAKMISVALWGGVDNAALYASGNVGAYTDVVTGAWYMGYVNYLTVTGVMTGKGEGEFDPDGEVTGYELLKMALVALGYNAETEKLTGLGWDLRTMAIATLNGEQNLTEGTTVTDWNAPLNRMNSATIIANMIYRNMVGYNVLTGKVETIDPATSFGEDVLGMEVVDATLVANAYGNVITEDMTGYSDLDADEDEENAYVYVTGKDVIAVELDSDIHDLGTPVKLYYTENAKGEDVLVATTLTGWTEIAANVDFSKWQTKNWDVNGTATVVQGYVPAGYYLPNVETTIKDFNDNGLIDADQTIVFTELKEVKDVIETENFGTIYQITDTPWNAKTMDKADIALNANFITADDIGAEKGNYIVYSVENNVYGETYNYGYVLGATEGKVDRVVFDEDSNPTEIYIDGVKTANTDLTVTFGAEGTFYTYANGTVAKFVAPYSAPTATKYAVVYDAGYETVGTGTGLNGTTGVIVEVIAILEDGTVGTYEVNSITIAGVTYKTGDLTHSGGNVSTMSGKDADGNTTSGTAFFLDTTSGAMKGINHTTTPVDYLVTYTLTDDGKMNITGLVSGSGLTDGDSVTSGVSALTNTSLYLSSASVNFVQTQVEATGKTETWVVYTGTSTPSYTATGNETIVTGDLMAQGDSKLARVIVHPAFEAAVETADSSFYYVISNNGQTDKASDGSAIYSVTVYDTETNEVYDTVANQTIAAGSFYTSYNEGTKTFGYAEGTASTDFDSKVFLTTISGNLIQWTDPDYENGTDATGIIEVDKDTKYYLIDGEDSAEIALSDLSVQDVTYDKDDDDGNKVEKFQAVVVGNDMIIVFGSTQTK